MPIDIETFSGKNAHIDLSAKPEPGIRLKKTKPNKIPLGHYADVKIGPDKYKIHDLLGENGQSAGAEIIEVRFDQTGVVVDLNPQETVNAINMNIFRWTPS